MSKEYFENIYLINYLVSVIKKEDKRFNLLITVKDNIINYKMAERDKLWLRQFTFEECQELKDKMGFDGSWKSYFISLDNAINRTNGGDIAIRIDKNFLVLTLYHPLTEDFKIKSEIAFETCFEGKSDKFLENNNEYINELYEAMNAIKIKTVTYNAGLSLVESNNIHVKRSASKLDVKKPTKRKYNANLINPNIKKRKGNGVKFTEDDDIEECEELLNN
jgi:hypothetical protein